MNFKNLIFEEQSPHSRDFSHELGNVSFQRRIFLYMKDIFFQKSHI